MIRLIFKIHNLQQKNEGAYFVSKNQLTPLQATDLIWCPGEE